MLSVSLSFSPSILRAALTVFPLPIGLIGRRERHVRRIFAQSASERHTVRKLWITETGILAVF